jgi:hypothetical protein
VLGCRQQSPQKLTRLCGVVLVVAGRSLIKGLRRSPQPPRMSSGNSAGIRLLEKLAAAWLSPVPT